MGFEKFGQYGYVSQTKVASLVSYLEKREVVATRCKKCGTMYFPPRADCLKCRSSIVDWVPIDGKGKLVTFTEVYFAPPVFQSVTPYFLGVAEMDNGLRVFAPISREFDYKELRPDLRVVLKPKQAGERVFYQLEKA